MSTEHELHVLVEGLVARSGLPASPAEVEALVAGAPAVEEAIRRLQAVEMDHETEPAMELVHPEN